MVDDIVADKTVQTTGSGEGSGGTAVPKFPDFSKLTRVQAVLDTNKYVHTMHAIHMSLRKVSWRGVAEPTAGFGKPGPGEFSPAHSGGVHCAGNSSQPSSVSAPGVPRTIHHSLCSPYHRADGFCTTSN